MREDVLVATATNVRDKLRQHLLRGYALKRQNISMESAEVIRFNAVADSLLDGFSETTSLESAGEDIHARIVAMEGLLSNIKGFLFRKKKMEKSKEHNEDDLPLWKKMEWIDKELPELLKTYVEHDKTVTVIERYAPMFQSFSNLPATLKADATAYRALAGAVKSDLEKSKKFMHDLEGKFDRFVGNVDHPEEFEKVLKDLIDKQPAGAADRFREPSRDFLAFGKTPFLDNGLFEYVTYVTPAKQSAEVCYLSDKDMAALVGALKELCDQHFALWMYVDEYPSGVDATDPPLRGYIDFDTIDRLVANALFLSDTFEDLNIAIYENLQTRLEYLISGIVHYLKKVL